MSRLARREGAAHLAAPPEPVVVSPPRPQEFFSKNERDFLLKHVSECTFSGKDVLVLASIVEKLQSI